MAAATSGATLNAEEKMSENPEVAKIRAVLKAHDDATTSHDLNGVMAVLGPKAVIMGTGPGELYTGEDDLKVAYEHFFQGYDKGEQDFTYYVIHGGLSGEMGWLVASGEIKGKKDGKDFAFPMNVSVTVSKVDGAWKIAAMHFSTLTGEGSVQ
jgi:ketosteroid isomerase-like protein